MIQSLRATATFESTHFDPDREGPYIHGHTFTVSVIEQNDLTGMCRTLPADLKALAAELDRHKLSDMLYGGSETLDGVASWVMERLLLAHPRITSVDVSVEGLAGLVVREIR